MRKCDGKKERGRGRGVSHKIFMIPKYITSKKMRRIFLNLFSLILSFIAESEVP
jgi:hypothetical protein